MAQAKLNQGASYPTLQRERLDTAVLRDTAGFASIRDDWDELYQSCPLATPFQSWAWLYSWWEAYGEDYDLSLVTLRNAGGILVGVLPLMARRRLLLLLGGDKRTLYSDAITPYKDILIREGWEEEVARAGARALKEMGGWHVADLQELMPHSAAWHLFREWRGPKTSVPITDYLLMDALPWEEVLSSLSRRLRKTARRTLRQADRDGVRCVPADARDAERAARTLVALHRELWRGRRIAPEHLTPRYEAFVKAAARRTTERGIGRISEFRRLNGNGGYGEVLVSQFLLFDRDFVGVYVTGAREEATRRYQLETLSNRDASEVARAGGRATVSFMDGATRDKLRWADEVVKSHRAILGRPGVPSSFFLWAPYAGCHLLRERYFALLSGAQVYVHSEDAPRWVKRATQRYYALQSYPYAQGAPTWIKKANQGYWQLRHKYGFGILRYKYEKIRASRGMRRQSNHLIRVLDKMRC